MKTLLQEAQSNLRVSGTLRGDLSFENVSEAWNFHDLTASYGLVLADFDRDLALRIVEHSEEEILLTTQDAVELLVPSVGLGLTRRSAPRLRSQTELPRPKSSWMTVTPLA